MSIPGRRKGKRLRGKRRNIWYKLLTVALGVSLLAVPLRSFAAPLYNAPLVVPFGGYDVWSEDVNGDGHDDLIASQSSGIAIALGNGDGSFGSPQFTNVVSSARGIAFADFDGDEDLDLATSSLTTDQVTVLINDGSGAFTASSPITVGNDPQELATGDVDGDGNADLFVGHASGQALLLFGDGNGGFGEVIDFPGNQPRSVTIADFNNDGMLDLAQLNHFDHSVYVHLNQGEREFDLALNSPAGDQGVGLVAADFDRDGHMDLAYAANGDGTVDVLIGNGDGSFESPMTNTIGGNPSDVAAADFDGDGILDLAGSVSIPHVGYFVFIFTGRGDGTFEEGESYGGFTGWLTSGDFNEDGIDELVVLSGSDAKVFFARSEGKLAFDSSTYAAEESDSSVTVAVYRTDGDFGRAKARIRTIDGTAKAGTDYIAVDDTIVFEHKQTFATYTINFIDNGVYAGDRSFAIELSDPENGTVIGAVYSAAVTIAENDDAPDVVAPSLNASKFSVIDRYNGTADELEGVAGAVSEGGAIVRAYRWTDAANIDVVDPGELDGVIVLGTTVADGSMTAAPLDDLGPGSYAYVVTATDAAGNESAKNADAAVTFTLSLGDAPNVTPPDTTRPEPVPSRSSDGKLASLSFAAGGAALNLTPEFRPDIYEYKGSTTADRVTFDFSASHSRATVFVNGEATDGETVVLLQQGDNKIRVTVRAENGTEIVYRFDVYREYETPFADIAGHWAAADVGKAFALGIATGYSDGSFRPNASISRAEWLALLSRSLEWSSVSPMSLPFADEADVPAWARTYVAEASSRGVVSGYADGSFRGNRQMTRAEAAVMIVRAMSWKFATNAAPSFADEGDIPAWAMPYVAAAAEHGVLLGREDGRFVPSAELTRAEAVSLLVRLIELKS